jgi:hypothetical protein
MMKVKLFALGTALIVIPHSGGIATGQSKGSVEPSVVANAPLSELKVRLTDIRGEGSGEGGSSGGDTNFSSGTAKVEPFGIVTYKTSWTDSLDSFTGNGTGGQCAHGSGTVVLTTPNDDQLTLSQTGLSCNLGTLDFSDDGTFLITAATGRFKGYKGAGSVITGVYSDGLAFLHISGTLKLPSEIEGHGND